LENLHNSFPEKSPREIREIMRKFYLNLTDVIVETIKSYSISYTSLQKRIHFTNPELLADYGAKGQSVLVMASHQCNWEWQLLGSQVYFDFPMDGVYKTLQNKEVNKIMLHIRGRFGYEPIPMQNTIREILRRKDRTFIYGLVADQRVAPNEKNYWTTFLHQDTAFLQGTIRIAQLTQFPVLYIAMKRIKRGYYTMTFHPIATPPYEKGSSEIIECYVRLMEKYIAESPSDWLWSHRRWKYKRNTRDKP
jgi:KDO2-lipid IV(A) lauroyltransferase